MIARGAHLLSVRQHQSILAEKPAKPAVCFEIPFGEPSGDVPDIVKRLKQQMRPETSLEQIALKLANASILRMKQTAERYAKAKSVTNRVKEVRVARKSDEQRQVLSSVVLIEKKMDAASSLAKEQLQTKKQRAMMHNRLVSSRICQLHCEQDRSLDSKMERLKQRIKKAAVNRGNQLLLIRQNAERLRTRPNAAASPVKFEIAFEKDTQELEESVRTRLQEYQRNEKTIEEIVEKLARAQMRRSQQRE